MIQEILPLVVQKKENVKNFIPWNPDFVNYIKYIISKDTKYSYLYCIELFKSNYYVKN